MVKILCVEDEPDIRAEIVEELMDLGHVVVPAGSALSGMQAAIVFRPDIILCDCLMPGMTGPEMVRALRQSHPEFASTPFVVISAYADESHLEEARAAGAAAYLTKPMDFDELEAVLKRLIAEIEDSPLPAAQPRIDETASDLKG